MSLYNTWYQYHKIHSQYFITILLTFKTCKIKMIYIFLLSYILLKKCDNYCHIVNFLKGWLWDLNILTEENNCTLVCSVHWDLKGPNHYPLCFFFFFLIITNLRQEQKLEMIQHAFSVLLLYTSKNQFLHLTYEKISNDQKMVMNKTSSIEISFPTSNTEIILLITSWDYFEK